ncbi:hypothetical protein Q5762_39580, partial [Streptomyces sp. P9(2023)]|uniref:hypothetical protein n=1 Tax=Streptomyces sp. P9(2023) TaxID=3064394 RepID=UPI0028F42883
ELVEQYCAISDVGERNFEAFYLWLIDGRKDWQHLNVFAMPKYKHNELWVAYKRLWLKAGKPPYNPTDWHPVQSTGNPEE